RSEARLPPLRASRRSPERGHRRERDRAIVGEPRRAQPRGPRGCGERARSRLHLLFVATPLGGKEAMSKRPARQETVLVVEDDPTLRMSLRATLRSAGFKVEVASTGPEGL